MNTASSSCQAPRTPRLARGTRCPESRAAVVKKHMPMVHSLAKKIFRDINREVEYEELVAWGTTGLLEAMDRYVPGGEASLKTFAYYRVRGAMYDGIGSIAPLSRRNYRCAARRGDKHAIYHSDLEPELIIDPDNSMDPEVQVERSMMQRVLHEAISTLSKEQQHLVREHYFSGATLKAAGMEIGMSKSWACRKHARALESLRAVIQSENYLAA